MQGAGNSPSDPRYWVTGGLAGYKHGMRDRTQDKRHKGTWGTGRPEAQDVPVQDEAGEGSRSSGNGEKIGATRAKGRKRSPDG